MSDRQIQEADGRRWRRMRFKNNKVWVALSDEDRLLVKNGRVLLKYRLDQDYQYRVKPENVEPLEAGPTGKSGHVPETKTAGKKPGRSAKASPLPSDQAVHIYTDGACSGNPGPAGLGVVMIYKGHRKELSRYLGEATNNIAELRAIEEGLKAITNRGLPVVVHTDSNYALGLLTKGWKAKENKELVARIRSLASTFKNLRFEKVKGHSGCPENERADRLAVEAARKGAGRHSGATA